MKCDCAWEMCRQNAIRLEEKEKREKEMLQEIIEEADQYKVEFYRKRALAIENKKASNREKEKVRFAQFSVIFLLLLLLNVNPYVYLETEDYVSI